MFVRLVLLFEHNDLHTLDFPKIIESIEELVKQKDNVCVEKLYAGRTILHVILEAYSRPPHHNDEAFLKLVQITATESNVKMADDDFHLPMDFLCMKRACTNYSSEIHLQLSHLLTDLGSQKSYRW